MSQRPSKGTKITTLELNQPTDRIHSHRPTYIRDCTRPQVNTRGSMRPWSGGGVHTHIRLITNEPSVYNTFKLQQISSEHCTTATFCDILKHKNS